MLLLGEVAGAKDLPKTGILITPNILNNISKRYANIKGGQPDTVGDAPSATSQFSAEDAGLQDMSQNPNMSPEEAAGKHGTTEDALSERNSTLATYEDTLGVAVSTIGKAFGPTAATVFETIREDPRHSYSRMTSRFSQAKSQAKYGLPPSEYGLSLPSFSPTATKEPVGNIPMSQHEEQADRSRQQSEAAAAAAAAAQSNKESNKAGTSGIGDFGGKSGSTGGLSGGQGDSPGGSGSDGDGSEGPGGDWNTGGRIGALIQHLQTGGDVENADTNMEVANVPMGVVDDADGAPSPFSGGTGVEDDLDMDVEAGSYVLNAESVQLIGISDINAVIRDAYSIAAALGKEVPADYDPQNKVPIRISNGEAIIPKALVEIIGLDKLEKWNQKGLQLRKQKEEFMAEQQKQQPPQQQQVASEAPMQQQMQQLMSNGTLVKTVQQLEKEEARDFFRQEAKKQEEAGTQVPIEDVREWIKEQAEQVEEPTAANLQGMFRSGPPINQGITVEEIPDEPIESIPVPSEKQEAPLNKYNTMYGHDKYRYLLPKGKEITDMTISEIYNLQDSLRKETQDKSLTTTAVGGPQFLQKTIKDLLSRNKNITEDTLFTPDVQNQLTKQIFKEEKVYAFIENPIKKGQNLSAVQYNLAGRFASLPLKNNKSYHEGQKPAMTSDEFRKLLLQIQKLGTEKGIPLLIESIINAETSLRK